jgi:hypothetical protein
VATPKASGLSTAAERGSGAPDCASSRASSRSMTHKSRGNRAGCVAFFRHCGPSAGRYHFELFAALLPAQARALNCEPVATRGFAIRNTDHNPAVVDCTEMMRRPSYRYRGRPRRRFESSSSTPMNNAALLWCSPGPQQTSARGGLPHQLRKPRRKPRIGRRTRSCDKRNRKASESYGFVELFVFDRAGRMSRWWRGRCLALRLEVPGRGTLAACPR